MILARVSLGANLGDAASTVLQAFDALAGLPSTRLVARSSLYRSEPVDAQGPPFINAVATLQTGLDPKVLLEQLQAIEQRFGRQRPYPGAPRTLDLDLLLHGNDQRKTQQLTLPHPRLHRRAFVLVPLLEVAPDLAAPGLGPLAPYLAARRRFGGVCGLFFLLSLARRLGTRLRTVRLQPGDLVLVQRSIAVLVGLAQKLRPACLLHLGEFIAAQLAIAVHVELLEHPRRSTGGTLPLLTRRVFRKGGANKASGDKGRHQDLIVFHQCVFCSDHSMGMAVAFSNPAKPGKVSGNPFHPRRFSPELS